MLLAPVGGVKAAVSALLIVNTADPVVKALRRDVGLAVPFQPQQHLHAAGVFRPQFQHRPAVGAHVPWQDSPLVGGDGRVGMAGDAVIPHTGIIGRGGHLRQGVLPVAKVSMGMDGADGGRQAHCIRSCFTLWSTTWRFSSSRVMSSTVMPIWTISTMTWYVRSAIS